MDDVTASGLLEATRKTFTEATDAAILRSCARSLKDVRHREEEVLQSGAKALIHALAHGDEGEIEELERELAALRTNCSRLEKDVEQLTHEMDSTVRESALAKDVGELEQREREKRQEFERLGGEAQLRRQLSKPKSGGLSKLRRLKSLYQHITRIKWDLEAAEDETVGTVVDNKENVIKQFRLGPIRTASGELDNFVIANKVWQTLG
jgi:hypothetical protein